MTENTDNAGPQEAQGKPMPPPPDPAETISTLLSRLGEQRAQNQQLASAGARALELITQLRTQLNSTETHANTLEFLLKAEMLGDAPLPASPIPDDWREFFAGQRRQMCHLSRRMDAIESTVRGKLDAMLMIHQQVIYSVKEAEAKVEAMAVRFATPAQEPIPTTQTSEE